MRLFSISLRLAVSYRISAIALAQKVNYVGMENRKHLKDDKGIKFYGGLKGVKYHPYEPLNLQTHVHASDFRPNGRHSREFDKECRLQADKRLYDLANSDTLSVFVLLSHIASDEWYFRKAKEVQLVCVIIVRRAVLKNCPKFPKCNNNGGRIKLHPDGSDWGENIYANLDYTKSVIQACNKNYGWRASPSLHYKMLRPMKGGRWGKRLLSAKEEDAA